MRRPLARTAAGALLLACSCDAWAALPLGVRAPAPLRRCATLRCQEGVLPDAASEAIPPERLAEAWRRDEKAGELREMLKGCSLYVVGLGPRKAAIGRVLARRLGNYRFYDIGALMTSTYKSISGSEEEVSLSQLVGSEPLTDVEQLSRAILGEVQQYSRAVVSAWDGAVDSSDYMVMQQVCSYPFTYSHYNYLDDESRLQ